MDGHKPQEMDTANVIKDFIATYLMIRRHRDPKYPNNDAELGRAMQYAYDPGHKDPADPTKKIGFPKMVDLDKLVQQQVAFFQPALDALTNAKNQKFLSKLDAHGSDAAAAIVLCLPFMASLAKDMFKVAYFINNMDDAKYVSIFENTVNAKTGALLTKEEVAGVVARMYGFGMVQQLVANVAKERASNRLTDEHLIMLNSKILPFLSKAIQNDTVWRKMLMGCTSKTKCDEAWKIAGVVLEQVRLAANAEGKGIRMIGGDAQVKKAGKDIVKVFDVVNAETNKVVSTYEPPKTSVSLPVTDEEKRKVHERQQRLADELKAMAAQEKIKNPHLAKKAEALTDIHKLAKHEVKEKIVAIRQALKEGITGQDEFESLQSLAQDIGLEAFLNPENAPADSLKLSSAEVDKFMRLLGPYQESEESVDAGVAQQAADELKALPLTREQKLAQELRDIEFGSSGAIIRGTGGSASDSRKIRERLRESTDSINISSSESGPPSTKEVERRRPEEVIGQEKDENKSKIVPKK